MKINLTDIGNSFAVTPINDGNQFRSQTRNGEFRIRPGIYLLEREGTTHTQPAPQEFIAPPAKDALPLVWHETKREWIEGKSLGMVFTVVAPNEPENVTLDFAGHQLPLHRQRAYHYGAEIPVDWLKAGQLSYRLTVRINSDTLTFPKDKPAWALPLVARGSPAPLFEAGLHKVKAHGQPVHQERLVPGMTKGRKALQISVEQFGAPPSSVTFRNELSEDLDPHRDDLLNHRMLRVRLRALESTTSTVEIVLTEENGAAWGTNTPVTTEWREERIPLTSLRYFGHWAGAPKSRGGKTDRIELRNLSTVSVTFGAWLYPQHTQEKHTVEIESISLE